MGNLARFISPEMLALARARLRGEQPAIRVAIGPDALIPLTALRGEVGVSEAHLRSAIRSVSDLWCTRCQVRVGDGCCTAPRYGVPMKDVEAVVREAWRRVGKREIGVEK